MIIPILEVFEGLILVIYYFYWLAGFWFLTVLVIFFFNFKNWLEEFFILFLYPNKNILNFTQA